MDNKFENPLSSREAALAKLYRVKQEIDDNAFAADLGSYMGDKSAASSRQDDLFEVKNTIEKNIGNRNPD